MDAAAESQSLEHFWGAIQGREDGFVEFFHALERINRMLKRWAGWSRSGSSKARSCLSDTSTDGSPRSARRGRVRRLPARQGPTIELVVCFVPEPRRNGLHVKAYPKPPSRLMPGYDHVPLGFDYSDPDADIAERFVEVVKDLQDGTGRRH